MRARLLICATVLALALPGVANAVIPDAVPDVTLLGQQAARGGGVVTTDEAPVTPTAKTVDGDISDWTGAITRFGGTAIYSRGEYVYQDYIGDNFGADDGQDAARTQYTDQANGIEPRSYRAEALAQAAGEQFGADCGETVCAVAHYGNVDANAVRVETDIEEVRVAADASKIFILVRTAGMTAADKTAVAVRLVSTSGEFSFLASGDRVESFTAGAVSSACSPCPGFEVASNPSGYTNAVELSVDRALAGATGSSVKVGVGTGIADHSVSPTALQSVRSGDAQSDLVNVAFRFNEPQRIWMDHDQALALRAGNTDQFLTSIDLGKLQSGTTQRFQLRPGYYERTYFTNSEVNRETENSGSYFQGAFQHYGVYLPSAYRPGVILPATWWGHYRGGHAHDAAAWVPGLLRQFGEQKNTIMIFPSARGTSSWYVGRGMEDFLNVWDDSMAAFPIDPNRVSFTGYSMGGFASWLLPMLMPDRFAGASPQEGPPTQGLWAGTPENSMDPGQSQNGGDPHAEFMYNLIENVRNVPYVIYHGSNDELVPISGIAAMQARFDQLGYRSRLYTLDGNEHYTTAVLDMWTEAADYLANVRRDPNPARVTYRAWPALENAASTISVPGGVDLHYRFRSAYWVSGLELRSSPVLPSGKPDPAAFGTIDAQTLGRGADQTVLVPEAGAGTQGTPYEMQGLRWLTLGKTAPANSFTANLTNLSSARLDLERMAISTGDVITATVTSDGSSELHLSGWSSAPTVTGATATYAAGELTLTVGSGTSTITITP